MKIILKNLKQVPHAIEVPDDTITVLELKEKVEMQYGFDSTTLKLIFNGVVLDNAKTLAECKIRNDSVIIMMNSKLKPINVPKEEPKAPTTTTTPAPPKEEQQKKEEKPEEKQKKPKVQKDYSKEINSLMEMGFGKEESEAAIKASRGNIQYAVEFLYNGIPSNVPNVEEMENEDIEGEGDSHQEGLLKTAASIVKIYLERDPNSLQQVMLSLQQNNPQLIELIKQNEERFKSLIYQPVNDEDRRVFNQIVEQQQVYGHHPHHTHWQEGIEGEEGLQGQEGQEGQEGQGVHRHVPQILNLTPEEFAAVKRLKQMGNFTDYEVAQAYFAFDKNEEMAANFLFENKMNDQQIQYNIIEQPQQSQPQQEEKKEEEKKEEEKKE